jgi:hypothetical protein
MRRSPSIAPSAPEDVDVYMVLDDFSRMGSAWRQTDEERADRATVVQDLLRGQYSNPVRVIAFNTEEGRSRDVSEEIADEIALACAIADRDIPEALEEFVDPHGSDRSEQLPLPLRGCGLVLALASGGCCPYATASAPGELRTCPNALPSSPDMNTRP